MSNPFLQAVKDSVYSHGVDITFVTVTEGTYDTATGSVTNTEVNTTVKAFPKNVRTNQYNLPNLIGKQVTEFLIVPTDLAVKPNPQDKVIRGGITYTVDSVKEHAAQGEVVLLKVIVYKG